MPENLFALRAAYHEAGHIVVAAGQGLRLRSLGMHIDLDGRGIAFYERRKSDDGYGVDELGTRTVISLFSGLMAQQKFDPASSDASGSEDQDEIRRLLTRMYIPPLYAGKEAFLAAHAECSNAEADLRRIAGEMVTLHWATIEALAQAVWERPLTLQDAHQPEPWSDLDHEKTLCGNDIAEILLSRGVHAIVVDDQDDSKV